MVLTATRSAGSRLSRASSTCTHTAADADADAKRTSETTPLEIKFFIANSAVKLFGYKFQRLRTFDAAETMHKVCQKQNLNKMLVIAARAPFQEQSLRLSRICPDEDYLNSLASWSMDYPFPIPLCPPRRDSLRRALFFLYWKAHRRRPQNPCASTHRDCTRRIKAQAAMDAGGRGWSRASAAGGRETY